MGLHVGVLINPLAGIGGAAALKGSDGARARVLAAQVGRPTRACERAARALKAMADATVQFSCWAGDMGASTLEQLHLPAQVLGQPGPGLTSAQDTRTAAQALVAAGVDILLFAGGDGTARDIFDVLGPTFPVLGIPAGVKMHSGVFAVSPEAAGALMAQLASGGLVNVQPREVRDIDEEAFRRDVVRSQFYGELLVPVEGHYLQHTKIGGREDPQLAAVDIADWVAGQLQDGRTYLIGPGSTTAAITVALGLPHTLLGVDAIRDGKVLASDANEDTLLALLRATEAPATIVVTAIGGQGHLFGRGNQQFSPSVLRHVGLDNIMVVAARSKISALEGRPLLVDTNDPALDLALCGYRRVITGYDDAILYRVDNGSSPIAG